MSRTAGSGSFHACAKAILCGEHFVLHGAPALAVPLPERTLRLSPAAPGAAAGDGDGRLAAAWNDARAAFGLAPAATFPFRIDSTIPAGAGLGSSAALGVALARAAVAEAGVGPAPALIAAAATTVEARFHGRSSGLDPLVIALGRPVLLRADGAFDEVQWRLPGQALVVALVPGQRRTADAVARVAAAAEADPAGLAVRVDEAARRALDLVRLVAGQWGGGPTVEARARAVGEHLSAAHLALAAVGVSSPRLDRVVTALVAAGAWGAKLTGAGLAGAVVALVPREGVEIALEAARLAGAVDVFACHPAGRD